jgi:hypothetical protein
MRATKQPPYSECDEGAGIRLGFDRVAQRLLEAARRLTRGVCRLSIEVLSGTSRLIRYSLGLRSRIAGDLAESFLSLTAQITSGPFYAVLIHGRFLRLAVKPPQSTKVPYLPIDEKVGVHWRERAPFRHDPALAITNSCGHLREHCPQLASA